MARAIIVLIGVIIAAGASLALRTSMQRRLEVDETGRYVGLADGWAMPAPDGSITGMLVD